MNEDLEFRFSVRRVPEGEALTFAEIEQRYLKKLRETDGKCVQSLGNLAEMYARAGRHDEACDYVRRMIALTDAVLDGRESLPSLSPANATTAQLEGQAALAERLAFY